MSLTSGTDQIDSSSFSFSQAVGGWRGVCESAGPIALFLGVYIATGRMAPALVAALGFAGVAALARLWARADLKQVAVGFLGVAIGAAWAAKTGNAADFFALGLVINIVYASVLAVSVLVRQPVAGWVLALTLGWGKGWRADASRMRPCLLVTAGWAGLFAARVAVQGPLYLSGAVEILGIARLTMGLPLVAVAAWATWAYLRPRVRRDA
ncbi:MAG: DUF3159 domain-containing protein [Actinomycetaceae bacterium]|nr:DUF3159 domain-containing protein [Actinomycetaceae bacterium]